MAQIVEREVRSPRDPAGLGVGVAQCLLRHGRESVLAREEVAVSSGYGEAGHVLSEVTDQVRWDADVADAGCRLGRSHVAFTLGTGHGLPDADDPLNEVEVAATETADLARPQPTPASEQDGEVLGAEEARGGG